MKTKLLSLFILAALIAGCTSITSKPGSNDGAASGSALTDSSAEALPSGINEDVSEFDNLDEELALEGEEIPVEELESIDF